MKSKYLILRIFLGLFILLNLSGLGTVTISVSKTSETIQPFDITFLNNTIGNLNSYKGKPLVLEWAASWCITCEDTQRAMKDLYPLYKDSSYFISLSYGGSGDTIDKFSGMKNGGSYQWEFALDHTNFAATVPIGPGSLWILDSNFNLIKDWRGVILTSKDIQNALNSLVDVDNQQSLLNPTNITPGSFQPDNPLFIIFLLLVITLVLSIVALKIKSQGTKINFESEISKSDRKVSNEISNLKTIIAKENDNFSKQTLSRQQNRTNKRRRNRRSL